jgi:hypothetical protein
MMLRVYGFSSLKGFHIYIYIGHRPGSIFTFIFIGPMLSKPSPSHRDCECYGCILAVLIFFCYSFFHYPQMHHFLFIYLFGNFHLNKA